MLTPLPQFSCDVIFPLVRSRLHAHQGRIMSQQTKTDDFLEKVEPLVEDLVAYATSKVAAAATKFLSNLILDGLYGLADIASAVNKEVDRYLQRKLSGSTNGKQNAA